MDRAYSDRESQEAGLVLLSVFIGPGAGRPLPGIWVTLPFLLRPPVSVGGGGDGSFAAGGVESQPTSPLTATTPASSTARASRRQGLFEFIIFPMKNGMQESARKPHRPGPSACGTIPRKDPSAGAESDHPT